jgi:O-antigen ligase
LLGAIMLTLAQQTRRHPHRAPVDKLYRLWWVTLLAWISWTLVTAVAAAYPDLALREWRTVFLAAPIFLWLIHSTLAMERHPQAAWLLVASWLAGGIGVAVAGLWQYHSGEMVIVAEGVRRVRGFYGSPNNLALYLERTFMVTLALACFLPNRRAQWLAGSAAILMGGALLLTFSKGVLLLAIPAGLLMLWIGGWKLLLARLVHRSALGWIALVALLAVTALLPFFGAQRFQQLLDFSQGTGFLRLQLWRSSWQMALDHLWLGVGPDQFLYHFRSMYLLPAAWQEPDLNHPHNLLLDLLTRSGLPGLLFGLAFFATGFMLQWRMLRAAQPSQSVLALGLLAATTAALTHGMIDASYALPDLMLVWVFLFAITARSWQSPPPV